MEIKKYKCPSCGLESMVCDAYRMSSTEPTLYLYHLHCQLYRCNLPFYSMCEWNKPDDIQKADELYSWLVDQYKKYSKKEESDGRT